MCGSDMAPGPSLINEQTEGEDELTGVNIKRTRGRQSDLFLSRFISLSLSPCVCAYCRLQQFHNPWLAGQPAQRAVLLRSTHTWTATVQQQERASPAFTCRSCLQPPWGWILLLSLINVAGAEINLQHCKTLGFCLWGGVARTDKLGVYLKVFYFGQWPAPRRAPVCDNWLPSSGECSRAEVPPGAFVVRSFSQQKLLFLQRYWLIWWVVRPWVQ